MATDNDAFGWLVDEIATIKSRRFHDFEPVDAAGLRYVVAEKQVVLQGEFAEFMLRFGLAKLFMDHRDAPELSVYPLSSHRRVRSDGDQWYVGFGFNGNQSVYFDESRLFEVGCSEVFIGQGTKIRAAGMGFAAWLEAAYRMQRKKFSPRRWAAIQQGPKPFSSVEEAIVSARRQYAFRLVGVTSDGDALLEIENNSPIRLPYLTVGVQGRNGTILRGAVWIDVANIAPGQTVRVVKDCYKDRIPYAELELFAMPDPIPEKRASYWEFGPPK